MPYIRYKNIDFNRVKLEMIARVNAIVADYKQQGYSLTLRQVYYQFVSRDWFPTSWADPTTGSTNNEKSYKKLGDLISDGRMAGTIDWNSIVDRQRELDGNSHWKSPQEIIEAVGGQFKIDKWEGQKYRVEIWVEKDALKNVVERAAKACDVNYLSCRGYTSQTAMWDGAQRMIDFANEGIEPVILHLGDHDPSGIDMSRDIEERIRMFMEDKGDSLIFKRIALNMPQVQQFKPPPNPAKSTDSRFKSYRDNYGTESWELDALDPTTLDTLIRRHIAEFRDDRMFDKKISEEKNHRGMLQNVAIKWDSVTQFIAKKN